MKKTNIINRILQNTSHPQGFWGRMILRGMNRFHAPMANRGMAQIPWQPAWTVLDIGCGGGANISRLLAHCPQGNVYGIDISAESVAFARNKNRKHLESRCFIWQGNVCSLPYADEMFDAATAFETVYFWPSLPDAFSNVARVLRHGGYFLICMEESDPHQGKMWTDRIDGMVIHTAEELEQKLSEAGFADITTVRHKKELYIVARKK